MSYHYSGGLILGTLFLAVVIAFPMKVGAHIAGARNTGLIRCGLAAFVGLSAGVLTSAILGRTIGAPLAMAIGSALAIRWMLGTSFFGAIGLMLVAVVLSLVGFALLAQLGIITSGPVPSSVIAT